MPIWPFIVPEASSETERVGLSNGQFSSERAAQALRNGSVISSYHSSCRSSSKLWSRFSFGNPAGPCSVGETKIA